eukprot:CAMPEP_0197075210 /NCGR_PEP_ID=MMETSP1384-20130603/211493_1 /TAXON_ID=29189 /ORGANISM="Ammonia sp." /LENGTH=299 /DNA_ID=CAMNT_0042514053 /DNA_START=140 /DNA_END=1040 /DNA_ORIENTATION=-
MSTARSMYSRSSCWSNKSDKAMRERIANEMKAQILATADTEIRTQYDEQQAKLRKQEERLQSNLAIQHPPYWTQPPQQAQQHQPLPPLPSAHVQTASISANAIALPQPTLPMYAFAMSALPSAHVQVASISANAIALPQPTLPMYAFANVGCLVYEQNHASDIMHNHLATQPPVPQAVYVNNHIDTNETNQRSVRYVNYHCNLETPQKAWSAATVSPQRDANGNGNYKGETQGTSRMASVSMAAPAASTSTLGTFVRSNESVQNLDSAVNSVVNSVNYSVDHDQDYESCLNFYFGGLDQ